MNGSAGPSGIYVPDLVDSSVMAHGRRRIWAGAGLLGLGVLAGAAVVASRWYAFEARSSRGQSFRILSLVSGEIVWDRFPLMQESGYPAWVPDGFSMGRFDIPKGPVLMLSEHAIGINRILVKAYGSTGRGMSSRLVAGSWMPDGSRERIDVVAWPFPLLLVGFGVIPLWSGVRQRRRWKRGHCLKCGYDLRSTPAAAPCPECGGVRVPETK